MVYSNLVVNTTLCIVTEGHSWSKRLVHIKSSLYYDKNLKIYTKKKEDVTVFLVYMKVCKLEQKHLLLKW